MVTSQCVILAYTMFLSEPVGCDWSFAGTQLTNLANSENLRNFVKNLGQASAEESSQRRYTRYIVQLPFSVSVHYINISKVCFFLRLQSITTNFYVVYISSLSILCLFFQRIVDCIQNYVLKFCLIFKTTLSVLQVTKNLSTYFAWHPQISPRY